MADETPRGGIRITSDPDETRIERSAPEDAQETSRRRFRLLFASDLAPHRTPDWEEERAVVRVDKYRFDDLLERLAPQLEIEVPNRLSGRPARLDLSLTFSRMEDFRPEGIAMQVAPLRAMLQARGFVQQAERGDLDAAELRDALTGIGLEARWRDRLTEIFDRPTQRSRPKQPSGSGDASLDRLLGMVDASRDGDAEPQPESRTSTGGESGLMGALLDAAGTGSGTSTRGKAETATVLQDLDAMVAAQVNAVLNHRAVRRLEAAWRGLAFLVDRIDFRGGVRLDVLPAGREALDEALYHQVLLPEHRPEEGHLPLSLIVLDASFDHSLQDVELLGELADTAASLQVPMIAGVAPSFFGTETHAGLARLPLLWQHLERPEYVKWQALREQEATEQVALALPPFVLRPPYGPTHPTADFDFEEEGLLWGSGALLVAVAIAESAARTGRPAHFASHPVGDLPLRPSAQGPTPLAALFTSEKQAELARAGFLVLGARNDAAHVRHAPTLRRTASRQDDEATRKARAHASLPCRLFVTLAGQQLLEVQERLEAGTPLDEAQKAAARHFRQWMDVTGEAAEAAVQVEHLPEAQTQEFELLAIRLSPPDQVLEEEIGLVLGLPVPRARAADDGGAA